MSFVVEFGAFALKGKVIDRAVGVIIDSAFGKIVDAAVSDLVMPLVALALGLSLIEARKLGALFAHGGFITVALNTRKSRPRHAYALSPMPPPHSRNSSCLFPQAKPPGG